MTMQSPFSSSSFSYAFTYQVFLSFRGLDTRHSFTGNLYKALINKGIHTFIDDNDLQRGDEISPSLIKAIEESRIFIPVFSINYASSSFCLDELVHIIHCYKIKGRLVLPVFFGVDPTDVRHHTGSYGKDLTKHEESFKTSNKNMGRWHQWKIALTEAANLSGHHYSSGYEYKFIEKIVEDISNRINRVFLHVAKYPVGLQSQVQQVKLLLDMGYDDGVHMVGLYGIGGLGKSALARAIYNLIADQFECLCFIEDVRENSTQSNLKHLQEKLLLKTVRLDIKLGGVSEGITIIKQRLSRKKILLILDDIHKLEQLEALAGGLDWFGRGSRVIITTRDKHLLTCHGIESKHAVEGLYGTEALELLRWMAFKNNNVPSSYEDILNRAVSYASGLPLVIEIVGSNLFGKGIEEWKYTLDGYERIPNKEIQKILRVSYDALEEEEQSVFLDIACCFKGYRLSEIEELLHVHYGHFITHHLRVLVDKSLIKINPPYHQRRYDVVTLHDLIEDMGKEIVRNESIKEPGERSRLWSHDDIVHVLRNNTGTSNIQMIYLNCPSKKPAIDWNRKAFKKMINLKTLIIIKSGKFSESLKYLPSTLRVLKWNKYPWKSLSSIILNKASEISSFPNCVYFINLLLDYKFNLFICIFMQKFDYMKVLTLDNCKYLTHIPNVSGLQNLEKLSFEKCNNLITIHASIGQLNKLEILNAKKCFKLESFPPLRLPSLKKLEVSRCESLKSFPELLCKMTNIKDIMLSNDSIGELPYSFQNLSELCDLKIWGCEMLRFSSGIFMMPMSSNVEYLEIQYSKLSDECLKIILKWFVNGKHLNLSRNKFKILPECLSECHLLRILELDECESLEEIRGIPPNLETLSATRCYSMTSSCRRMLLSQQLNEAGCTNIRMRNKTFGIPDWFEHQVRGNTISFSFRKEIPSITSITLFEHHEGTPSIIYLEHRAKLRVNLFVNGYESNLSDQKLEETILSFLSELQTDHTYLFDLKLEERINSYNRIFGNLVCELDEALLKNEWIHVELQLESGSDFNYLEQTQMGIHVCKEKRSMEKNVIFSSRREKRKLDEDSIDIIWVSLSRIQPRLKKQRLVDVEVSETELVQQQQQHHTTLSSLISYGLKHVISLLGCLQTVAELCCNWERP